MAHALEPTVSLPSSVWIAGAPPVQVAGQQGAYAAHMINRGYLPREGGMEQASQCMGASALAVCTFTAGLCWSTCWCCRAHLLAFHPACPTLPGPCPPCLQPPPSKPVGQMDGLGAYATMGSTMEGSLDEANEVGGWAAGQAGCSSVWRLSDKWHGHSWQASVSR
jgi:hypothetical protein